MTPLQAIVLGVIQGITEFLPISSSGHLVLIPALLGWQIPDADLFVFDVLVQVATVGAVIGYFWHDVADITSAVWRGLRAGKPFAEPAAQLGWLLALATVPAGLAYLLFNGLIESAFSSPKATATFLLGTAALLVYGELNHQPKRDFSTLTWKDALIIGLFQILALFPGISRSGATIVGGMHQRLDRPAAARFSFLISLPLMAAAGLVGIWEMIQIPGFPALLPTFSLGFLAAGVMGYLSVRWLMNFVRRHPLTVFALYCALFGLFNLIAPSVM